MPDIDQIRDMLPSVHNIPWLNTSACGPLPTIAFEAMRAELTADLAKARIDQMHFPHIFELRDGVRAAVAGLIAFNVAGLDGPTLTQLLAEEHNVTIRYVTRYINNPDAARVSVGFYNDEGDIARFTDGIQAIQTSL